ncbi:APC family permease [Paenarthrobacter sp. NPDC090520]|uniref:APC family permease n=1 Tax=Paenarthrobacter sp. NPDC090520 TaxID=3364382 RepID=UPI003821987F
MRDSSNHASTKTKPKLPLWAALALSLATVGPTLAMSGNGQGLIGIVGKSIPLVFVIGLVAVGLVAYGFVRLTRHLNHAGSAYALVGGTVGPRAGFFAGFAMLGAYLAFSIGTLSLTAAFVNSLLVQLQGGSADPFQIPWPLLLIVSSVLSLVLAGREAAMIAKILLIIEGVGIVAMIVLVVVIFARGGASTTGVDFSVLSFDGVNVDQIMAGVVAAFLSWAGFEACASLGEETDNPKRNIPRALGGTLLITGVLFAVVMFSQTIGFGTDDAGLARMQTSSNTLGDLGHDYIGTVFSLIIIFTGICAAFGCHVATSATAGRMIYAFARDGFGPSSLSLLDEKNQVPRRATILVVILALVAGLLCSFTGWPVMGTNNPPIDMYFLFAVAGAVCLMVAYFMVEVSAIWFTGNRRFDVIHGGRSRFLGIALPAVGAVIIALVIWFNVKDAATPDAAPLLGLYWCGIGLIVAFAASRAAVKVGIALTKELNLDPVRKTEPQGTETLSQ